MEVFRTVTAFVLALALWWALAVTGNSLLFPTPVPDAPSTSWVLIFQPLYAALFGVLPPLLIGLISPRSSLAMAIAFGVAVAFLEQHTRPYQLVPASLLGSCLAHAIEAVIAAMAGVLISTRLSPNNSFKPKPFRGSA